MPVEKPQQQLFDVHHNFYLTTLNGWAKQAVELARSRLREPSIFNLPDSDAHTSIPNATPLGPSTHFFPAPYAPIKALFNPFAVPNDADLWIRRQSARREREAAHAAPTPTIDALLDGFNAMDVNTSMADTQAASASISVPELAPTPRPQKALPRRFNGNAKKSHAAPNRPSARTFSNSSSSTSSESSSADSGLSRCSSYSTIASSVPATPEALECELPRVGGFDSESEGPSSEGDDDAGISGQRSKIEADPFVDEVNGNKWEELLAAVSVVSRGA
ncbi:hypothetical protein BU17DRAFT_92958 [Hysterangium stoloniferum]|nr:hypothetical protein BU17DRAFT_92958 [Hysterangium stoloniferum]